MATSKTTTQKVNTANSSGFLAITFVVIFIIVFLALGYVLVISPLNDTPDTPTPTPSVQSDKIVQIPFDYTVTSIDDSMITLAGNNGDMLIPKDPTSVSVYNGTPESNTTVGIGDLEVGNKVILKLIPGQIAWLYVVE